MTGKTISNYVYNTVTLGVGGYVSPLTIATTGEIYPLDQGAGATGIYLAANQTLSAIVNHGDVYGTTGYYNDHLDGGVAISLKSAALISNTGQIIGAYGGDGGNYAQAGGNGVDVLAFASITNAAGGLIQGGVGGSANNPAGGNGVHYGAAGVGGAAVYFKGLGTLNNAGTLRGGRGGGAEQPTFTVRTGGFGLLATAGVAVINSGRIIGGAAGVAGYGTAAVGNLGGIGVGIFGVSQLSNSGVIAGGAGGYYSSREGIGGNGNTGVALEFGTAVNTGTIIGGVGGIGSFGGAGGQGVRTYEQARLTNSKGVITGGTGGYGISGNGGGGGTGIYISNYSSVSSTGRITGGAGGTAAGGGTAGGIGGTGASIDNGQLSNSGTLTGGAGGEAISIGVEGGVGGDGIDASARYGATFGGATVINYGLVRAGAGGNVAGEGANAGAGGTGVSIFGASVSNHGTIIGGAGGYAVNYGHGLSTGGLGGNGAMVGTGGTLNNIGRITGGVGGSYASTGRFGGDGVYINGGLFITSGTVAGGYNGAAPHGGQGYAVQFGGSIAGTLVAGAGAKFIGGITSNEAVANVVVLTGTSAAALTGVNGIDNFSFATGAQRTLEAYANVLNGDTIIGFALHDTIVIDGLTANLQDVIPNNGPYFDLYSTSGFADFELARATAKAFVVTDAGGKTTLAVAAATAHGIGSTAAQFVDAGGSVSGTTINTGGLDEIYSGGTTTNTTIGGGTLVLNVGAKATGNIAFTSAKGGDLQLSIATMPTLTISGFIAGDTIGLNGLVYNSQDTVVVAKAGTVAITTPGVTYNLHLANATVGEKDFILTSTAGGVTLTKGATAAVKSMQFVAAAPTTVAHGAATMSGAAAVLPAPVAGKSHGFTAAVVARPVAGAVDLIEHARPAMFWLDSKHLIG